MTKQWCLVSYDIRDPKRWRKAYPILRGYGDRLQYSVFRCRLTRKELEELKWQLEKVLDPADSLLILELCDACSARVSARNRAETWDDEPPPRFKII